MALRRAVEAAFAGARAVPILPSTRPPNGQRSTAFVEALAVGIEAEFQRDDVRVFRKTQRADLFDRGGGGRRSEFLFDALACLIGYVRAPVHPEARPIGFVRAPLVQVESEFALDLTKTCEDFSKLVCGSAPQSLFVGPLSSRPENYLAPLGEIAPHVKGECFVALVPHPSNWERAVVSPQLHRWHLTRWERV